MSGGITPPLLETIARRAGVVERLLDERADKRELEAALGVSRTTVDRAVGSLSDANCIAYQDGKWKVTLVGRLAYEAYEQLALQYEALTDAQPLLFHLPVETPLDMSLLVNAEIHLAEPPAPHVPVARLEDLLQHSEDVEWISSVVLPRYVRLFHHHIVERETDTSLVFGVDLVEYLWATYSEVMDAVIATDNVTVWRFEERLQFGLVLVDEEVVWVAVHDDYGGLKGSIVNRSNTAVAWAASVFRSYRRRAEQIRGESGSHSPNRSETPR